MDSPTADECLFALREYVTGSIVLTSLQPHGPRARMNGSAKIPPRLVAPVLDLLIERGEELLPGLSSLVDPRTGMVYWFERFATIRQAIAVLKHVHGAALEAATTGPREVQRGRVMKYVTTVVDGAVCKVVKLVGRDEVLAIHPTEGRIVLGPGKWAPVPNEPEPDHEAAQATTAEEAPEQPGEEKQLINSKDRDEPHPATVAPEGDAEAGGPGEPVEVPDGPDTATDAATEGDGQKAES